LAAEAAGLLTRQASSLAKGEAVSSEIVNSGWKTHLGYTELPHITPEKAGQNLAGISSQVDFTFFAHYGTDYAGHRGRMTGGVRALERVDAFLGGILGSLSRTSTLVVASDHGNLEDITGGHTRNPVLCLIKGPRASRLREGRTRITDIPALILDALSLDRPAATD
jgi:bisphosphoglycerate-independent phosphoglycerate mutase (AlkP superfamily)